jgi:Ca2+-binding RTX toxin-like protein
MDSAGTVSVFGNHNFTINGSSGNDTIFDFTSITTGTNVINGNAGDDNLVVRSATAAATIVNGGAGNDVLIGGQNDQLYGGDGNDILLAHNGAAYLSGGAGNDVLFNAYQGGGAAVVMLGGSGIDTFALIGNNTHANTGATMNTTIADLSTGDKIDLSFLETHPTPGADQTLVIGDLNGKVGLTSAGAVISLAGFDISSSEGNVTANSQYDVNSVLNSGSQITASSAKASAVATAVGAGFGAESAVDFNSLFGHLTDTYHS